MRILTSKNATGHRPLFDDISALVSTPGVIVAAVCKSSHRDCSEGSVYPLSPHEDGPALLDDEGDCWTITATNIYDFDYRIYGEGDEAVSILPNDASPVPSTVDEAILASLRAELDGLKLDDLVSGLRRDTFKVGYAKLLLRKATTGLL